MIGKKADTEACIMPNLSIRSGIGAYSSKLSEVHNTKSDYQLKYISHGIY